MTAESGCLRHTVETGRALGAFVSMAITRPDMGARSWETWETVAVAAWCRPVARAPIARSRASPSTALKHTREARA